MMFNDEELKLIKDFVGKVNWWKNDKIVEKIDDYFDSKEQVEKCGHLFTYWVGEKNSCQKCESTKEENWSVVGSGFEEKNDLVFKKAPRQAKLC